MPFNRKDHLNHGEIRPRFHLRTTLSEEEVFSTIQQFVESDDTVVGRSVHNLYYLDIPHKERHFWSPELRVTAEKDEYADHDDTLVRVMVGPQHTVWIFFVFIYSVLGLVCLFGGMYGLSHLALGHSSPWIWCMPITIFLILGVYLIAKAGQRTGRDQTLHLVSCLYHALGHDNVERVDSYD